MRKSIVGGINMIDKINKEIEDTFKKNEELRLYSSLRKYIKDNKLDELDTKVLELGTAILKDFIEFHLGE